jgi:formimidoylglutamate deiminase
MKIYCKTLLKGDRWASDAVLQVAPNGVIQAIEAGLPQAADIVLDGIVVPGMPNAHSHSFQRLIAGLTGPRGNQRDSFWSWREAMYRTANRISPEQFGAVAQWVFVEMLRAGFTSCAEFHYLHHQPGGEAYANPAEMSLRVIEAASVSGIGLTLLPVLYCSAGFGGDEVSEEQKRFANGPEQYLQLLEICRNAIGNNALVELGVAPHSLRAVPAAILHEVLQSRPDPGCPVHIHIAEQPAEIEACRAHLGARPVEFLLGQFAVDRRWCLVHATHMTPDEAQAAAISEATAGLCPTTEADLGDGVFRTAEWLQAGGSFAVGSDSNVRISVAEELRLLEYNERLRSGQRNVLTDNVMSCGRFLYQHAANTGGVALGQAVGRLETGFRADLVELDGSHELLAGRSPDAALDGWIFGGDDSMLNSVWVAGRRLVSKGRHAGESNGRAAFAQVMKEMLQA